jgi:hypothetical protein
MADYCGTCEVNPAEVKGECDTCYRYRKRTGKVRPDATRRQIEANARWAPRHIKLLRKTLKALTDTG